ncbi:DUF6176 family protein [Georgenia sp. Z1491]|uniref:DUF6176 family protein n=1 Tax=Georgenia sp. Z1491 TaxID=3416707 RepID=UPI003CF059B5
MEPIPFRPTDDDRGRHPMPASVPPGLRLELSRARLLDGAEATFDEWMSTLHDRYDECEATLADERVAFEATFLNREADGSMWMYHLTLLGEDSRGLDPTASSIDADHEAYARRTKERGWEELAPTFLLAPPHIREAMRQWGTTGTGGGDATA